MDYQVKTFDELTTRQLHAIYRARTAVFVVEQNCPYQEVDGKDLAALHIFSEQDGAIAAYCRLIPAADGVHLGRVLVARPYRAQKLGRELVAFALECAARRFPGQNLHAQAQSHLQKFYASFGFRAVSDSYLEDGIPHTDMTKEAA